MNARELLIEPAEYHADPCETPSLSCSIALTLLERSALHAHHEHPKFGGHRSAPSDRMEQGTLIHRVLLRKGAELEPIEAKDWRTKAARAAREEAREAGKIPVLAAALTNAERAARVIAERLADLDIVLEGESEMVIAWQEATKHGPIWCRAMLDHVDAATVYDVKCTEDVGRAEHLVGGFALQGHVYPRALELLDPQIAGRVDFVLLFVEPSPPYAVRPLRLDGITRAYGAERWAAACAKWGRCLATNEWKGATSIETAEAPGWIRRRMEAA